MAGRHLRPASPDGALVSGGLPYGLVVPDACADALFVGETTMPFVSYLDLVLEHGRFPHGDGSSQDWWSVRRDLAKDLLPL